MENSKNQLTIIQYSKMQKNKNWFLCGVHRRPSDFVVERKIFINLLCEVASLEIALQYFEEVKKKPRGFF